MRTLYKEYYQKKKRGFTEEEFRKESEKIAGKPLPEIFEYISTVKELDYPKYLSYAGLTIDTALHEVEGSYFGALVQQKGEKFVVSLVEANSPSAQAGVKAGDEIVEVNGNKMDSKAFTALLQSKKPGEKLSIVISNNGVSTTKEIMLAKKFEKSFRISPIANPDPLQKQIWTDWSRGADSEIASKQYQFN
jgi:predicted metalloprotease with PDZ domain